MPAFPKYLKRLLPVAALVTGLAWLLLPGTNRTRPEHPVNDFIPGSAPRDSVDDKRAARKTLEPENLPGDPDPSASNEELLQLARNAIAISPEAALRWAESQSDSWLRERLKEAVLRAWGEADPRSAVNWALAQDEDHRQVAVSLTLQGAARQPEMALQIGRELLAADSETGKDYGNALVAALGDAGEFPTALRFVNESPAEVRTNWLATAFSFWGGKQPADALEALTSISDPPLHTAAFQALVASWAAANDFTALAKYAATLPAGEDRTFALTQAVNNWSLQDPAELGEWLNSLPPSSELDHAISKLVTQTDGVNRSPEIALGWVAGITDATLRRDSLLHVMKEWLNSDPPAAREYFGKISWLAANERADLQSQLQAASVPSGSLAEP